MHGRLFEIREQRLPEDEWMCVDHFYEEDTSSWCDWMQDSECREDDLEWLKESLPSSIFKVEGDEIEIISDGKDFVEGWISEVKKKTDELTYESFTSFMSTWYIRNKLKNMIDSDFMFKTDYEDYVHNPTDFIRECITQYQGKKLYVCGIIDYHF